MLMAVTEVATEDIRLTEPVTIKALEMPDIMAAGMVIIIEAIMPQDIITHVTDITHHVR